MRTRFSERYGKLAEHDRSFDLKFWQKQKPRARFDAAWELIAHAYKIRGGDVRQLRLHRSIETFQRQPGETESKNTVKPNKKNKDLTFCCNLCTI